MRHCGHVQSKHLEVAVWRSLQLSPDAVHPCYLFISSFTNYSCDLFQSGTLTTINPQNQALKPPSSDRIKSGFAKYGSQGNDAPKVTVSYARINTVCPKMWQHSSSTNELREMAGAWCIEFSCSHRPLQLNKLRSFPAPNYSMILQVYGYFYIWAF